MTILNPPLKLERILANGLTETEHWNSQRQNKTEMPVTLLRPGLIARCGCTIDTVHYGQGFSKQHDPNVCDMEWDHRETTLCSTGGQAVSRVVDADGIEYIGVMRLNGVWPHEESTGVG